MAIKKIIVDIENIESQNELILGEIDKFNNILRDGLQSLSGDFVRAYTTETGSNPISDRLNNILEYCRGYKDYLETIYQYINTYISDYENISVEKPGLE